MNTRKLDRMVKSSLRISRRTMHSAFFAGVFFLVSAFNISHARPVNPDSLCTPDLLWPVDSAGCLDSLVHFQWIPCAGATAYRLQVFESPDSRFRPMHIDSVVTGDAITLRVKQRYEGMIYGMLGWRVAAIKDTSQGEWSAINTFHVKTWRLLTWLDRPTRDDSGFVDSVRFSWFNQPCADGYHFQLSKDQSFFTMISEDSTLSDTTTVVRGLPLNTKFYWRVRSHGEGYGTRALWSLANEFKTHRGPPPIPVPLAPLDTVETAASTDLRWQIMDNTASSDLVLRSGGGRMIAADSGLIWTLYPIDGLEYDTLYQWQVRGRNDAFVGEWSQPQHFIVREHPTGVEPNALPVAPFLEYCTPHPLHGTGSVRYYLPRTQSVRLTVHDLLGRERKVIHTSSQESAGWHSCTLHAQELPSGLSLLVLQSARGVVSRGLLVHE